MPWSSTILGGIQKWRNRGRSEVRKLRTLHMELIMVPSLQTTFLALGMKTETEEFLFTWISWGRGTGREQSRVKTRVLSTSKAGNWQDILLASAHVRKANREQESERSQPCHHVVWGSPALLNCREGLKGSEKDGEESNGAPKGSSVFWFYCLVKCFRM